MHRLLILLACCAFLHTCSATGAASCLESNSYTACFNSLITNRTAFLNNLISEYETQRNFNFTLAGTGYTLNIDKKDNRTFDLTLRESDVSESRGMKKTAMRFLPFLIVPAFAMAGVMPWLIPPLKMVVMFVAMINNMAFTSSLFMLIRNYVFNRKEEEHIFYVNHGYKNHAHHHHHRWKIAKRIK